MYRVLIITLACILSPTSLLAQVSDSVVSNLLILYEQENWEEVRKHFKDFSVADPHNAEVFYWLRAVDNDELRPALLEDLAKSYLARHNHPKVISVYRELVLKSKLSINLLLEIASTVINMGDVRLTQLIYERVLNIDLDNLQANMFMGSFLFLRGEKELSRLNYNYKKEMKMSRMQYAEYRREYANIFNLYYAKSREYLERVNKQKKSKEITKTLDYISKLEVEFI